MQEELQRFENVCVKRTDLLGNALRSGRTLFGKIWGRNIEDSTDDQTAQKTVQDKLFVITDSDRKQIAYQSMPDNLYFTADSVRKQAAPQRIQTRIKAFSGRFMKRFGRWTGGFSKNGALHDSRQNARDDLRKKSRYRGEEVEFECILTDDSYLLDSYDRNGVYSRLTTERK